MNRLPMRRTPRAAVVSSLHSRPPARTPHDADVAASRRADCRMRMVGMACLVGLCWSWLVRATGGLPPGSALLTAGFVVACACVGERMTRRLTAVLPTQGGLALDLLVGFFCVNTGLFVTVLVSPFGMSADVAIVGVVVAVAAWATRERGRARSSAPRRFEAASFACIVFVGLAATGWTRDQQPIMRSEGGFDVFTIWYDAFIHARVVSAFAQAHGFATLSDIKLAGVPAAAYHVASYMMPAALDAMTPTTALDAVGAFQLPFGIVLAGLGAYVLVGAFVRTPWPPVVAAAAVLTLPDAYQQGFGLRYLSFHFMSQVNLGMLYGLACIALAWSLVVTGCHRGRAWGVACGFVLLAVCIGYKAHLFVANALIMMLYPCAFFGRFSARRRLAAGLAVVVLFVAVVAVSQWSPRVPTLRLDASGIRGYVDLLYHSSSDGPLRRAFAALYLDGHLPRVVDAAIVATYLLVGSFGIWLVLTPVALIATRRRFAPSPVVFVAMIAVNYLAMSMLLALDERGIGAPEEFLNRPHAWAYFVVVAFGAMALYVGAFEARVARRRYAIPAAAVAAAAGLLCVHRFAPNLQTFPEWPGYSSYESRTSVPSCVVDAARFVRDHSAHADILQDSNMDPDLVVTASSERQAFVSDNHFGGAVGVVEQRVRELRAVQASPDPDALVEWGRRHRVTWYLQRPDASRPGDATRTAAYDCDGYRVLRLSP